MTRIDYRTARLVVVRMLGADGFARMRDAEAAGVPSALLVLTRMQLRVLGRLVDQDARALALRRVLTAAA